MRLTLRTVLAYLDDILEPNEAREIGSKIAESGYASSLVNKIRDVVRRRRISAPDVTGPAASPDANIVAEYLDNALPAESVADLERICLESDMHLAEVAACHQILTLVLGEPVEIPSGMRESMYALGAVAVPSDGNGVASEPHVPRLTGLGVADVPRNTRPSLGESSLEDRLPDALLPRRQSLSKLLPYLLGAVVVGLWGYLMFSDETLTGLLVTRDDASRLEGSAEVDLSAVGRTVDMPGAPDMPGGPDMGRELSGAGLAESGASSVSIPPSAVAPPDLTLSPLASVDAGQPVPPATVVPPVLVEPMPDAVAGVDSSVAAVPGVMPMPEAFQPPEPQRPTAPPLPPPWVIQDVSTSGVLLQYQPEADDWFMLPRQSLIEPGHQVASPEPYEALLSIGDQGATAEVILRGGTRVRSLGSTDGGRLGFEVVEGRLVVRLKETAPANEPVSLRIAIREDVYDITLAEPATVLGIEVLLVLPAGEGDALGASRYTGGIGVIQGAATVKMADHPAVELRPHAGWVGFAQGDDATAPEPVPLVSLPNWLNPQAVEASATVRRYAALYAAEFVSDQPVSQCIRPVVKDRRPPVSELATKTLALTGRYPGLVDALSAPHEEARLAAIVGLQSWLSSSPDHAGPLQVELQDRFRPIEADAIYRLLWGFSEQDARNQVVAEDLLNWLEHDEIAIRELAFFHIHRLTDRRYDYRPNDPASQRAAATLRWRKYVKESGGLLRD